MAILKTKNLTKYFGGVKAVDDFSIKIEKGEITGLIGPNGSGKTTLINLLSGMLFFDKGVVVINKIKLKKIKSYKIASYGITRTFQNVRVFEQMTVLDNILVVLTKKNIFGSLFEKDKKYYAEKAKEALQRVDLWKKRNDLAINLSYGQKKLLEIARILVADKDIFFLDEPFAGLFPKMKKIVSKIILELKQNKKTIILIEHSMDLINELCDYVIVMDSGKLLAEGKPAQVLRKKQVVEAYLGK